MLHAHAERRDFNEATGGNRNQELAFHRGPHRFDRYYLVYSKRDPAKEPLATSESILVLIGETARKTGRPRDDFEVIEIPKETYQKLKQFLRS